MFDPPQPLVEPTLVYDRRGLPAWFAELPGPVTGALMFRVGIGDEPLYRRGFTHLIEHLTLHDYRNPRVQWNGFVDLNRTVFHATGPRTEVEDFLRHVTNGLSELPVERLDAERRVLSAEAQSRGQNVGSELLSRRFGAGAWGAAGWWELGIRHARHESVSRWMADHFTAGNAAIWLTTAPSEALCLELPPGSRVPPPTPRAVFDGRAWFRFRSNAVAFMCRLPRSHAASTAAGVVTMELQRRLRDAGLCYGVTSSWARLDAESAVLTVSCDSVPQRESELAAAVVAELHHLADAPPEDALANLRHARQLAKADDLTRASLDMFTLDLLLGAPRRTVQDDYLREQQVGVADVARLVRVMCADLLVAVPEQAVIRRSDLPEYPAAPVANFSGRRLSFSNLGKPADAKGKLVIGPYGVALTGVDHPASVWWPDAACVMRWDDGTRCVVNRRGDAVVVEPSRYILGHEATAVFDEHVADDRTVRIGPRYAAPAGPWCPPRIGRVLTFARWLVGFVLLATMMVAVATAERERQLLPVIIAFGAAGALLAMALLTTRSPSPHLWDNTHTRTSAPDSVDRRAWYVPTGLLVGWVGIRNRFSEPWKHTLGADLQELHDRSITGPELYRRVGGILSDDMLTSETNEFLADFLDQRKTRTSNHYELCLRRAMGSEKWFEYSDSWQTQKAVNEQLDMCYARWRRLYRWRLSRGLRRLLGPWSGTQSRHWAAKVIQRWRHLVWR